MVPSQSLVKRGTMKTSLLLAVPSGSPGEKEKFHSVFGDPERVKRNSKELFTQRKKVLEAPLGVGVDAWRLCSQSGGSWPEPRARLSQPGWARPCGAERSGAHGGSRGQRGPAAPRRAGNRSEGGGISSPRLQQLNSLAATLRAGEEDGLCQGCRYRCKLNSYHRRVTLCSFPRADSCSRKHMLRLLRLKGRTAEILFIDAIGRCSAFNVCPVRAGIASLLTMTTYLITCCVHNALYIRYTSPFPFGFGA